MISADPASPGLSAPSLPSPPHTEPTRLRAANATLRFLWDRGWAAEPSLAPQALIDKAAAKARTGPDDDRVGWRARLTVLCDDLEHHAQLSDLGRTLAHGQLVSALAARFRAHTLWHRHPEIADQPMPAPIVIVGQMRSGSTRMQRLLACDPRLTFTRFFESWNPIPGHGPVDARRLKGRIGLACAHWLNPRFGAIHPTTWDAPDEEIGLHNLSIYGAAFEAQWRVPNYTSLVERCDPTPVYREFRRLLQTLAWLRGASHVGPWVLKVPQFTQDLRAILRVFPDARLIHLRRSAGDVIASSASLVCNQMRLQSHHVDPHWIGQEWARKVALREARCAAVRADTAVPQVEIDYDDMSHDWEREMQRVYNMLRLPLTGDVIEHMRRYVDAADPARRERHVYHPKHFGLTPLPG